MQCANHPSQVAKTRCEGCAEPFCEDCLVEVQGQMFCTSCKVIPLGGKTPNPNAESIPCKEAGQALTYAIAGLFCFGIILAPIALKKASEARTAIAANPRLSGSGKATAATVIAIAALSLWLIGIAIRIAGA